MGHAVSLGFMLVYRTVFDFTEIGRERKLLLAAQSLTAKHDNMVVQERCPDEVDFRSRQRLRQIHPVDHHPCGGR